MPFVHIHWFEGRTPEQKAEVAKRITDALVEAGGSAREDVWIRFEDSKPDDWTFGGEPKP
jgi:4-oxalocrotonate tautomerase